MARRITLLMALSVAVGCGAGAGETVCPDATATTVYFDPPVPTFPDGLASSWLAFPFPADHRRRADGTLYLLDFPTPAPGGANITTYSHYGTRNLRGFSTNAPVYVRFTAELDLNSITPELGATSLAGDAAAPLQIIDITPTSPEYGRRRALRWELFTIDGGFVPTNTLAVAPAWGVPLRQDTTYAFIATSALRDGDGAPLVQPALLSYLLAGDVAVDCFSVDTALRDQLFGQYEPLRTLLAAEGTAATEIVAATVFTTQNITGDLAAIHADIQTAAPPPLDPNGWVELGGPGVWHLTGSEIWNSLGDSVAYYVMEGRYDSPNYQEGTLPYASDSAGGDFAFVDGQPQVSRSESLRFVLTLPATPPPAGGCYPIVQYAHGTTGDAWGFTYHQGWRNAARGLATIGIDQPLHGTRWSGSANAEQVSLYSFNFLNPAAARTLFRQSAVDTFALTRFVRESLVVPAAVSPTGQEICFDPQSVGFFGHSHGGLSGAIAAAFEDNITHWVLSGAGGGLSITMVERKDEFVDVQALLEGLLSPAPGEHFTEMHPVVGLIQTLSDVTDPINYAPFWHADTLHSGVKSILLTSGELDAATPHRTAAALAAAGGAPAVEPVALPLPGHVAAGLLPVAAPLSANAAGATVGFVQWADDGSPLNWSNHFVVFHRPEALHAAAHFLQTGGTGAAPVIERAPQSTAR